MTAQQAINAAMQHLGALTQGESPASSESTDFLQVLNDMMASWSTERLNIFSIVPSTHSLVSGTGSYTIGSSGTFNVTRPVRYERASIILPNTGGSGNRYHPLQIVDAAAWADILERSIGAVIPTVMFPDMAFPLTTLYLWPVPTFSTISVSLELWTWTQLTTFADLSTAYTFPPGYDRALKANLALEIAPSLGIVPSPQLMQLAMESKAAIRMINAAAPEAIPATGQLNALTPQAVQG